MDRHILCRHFLISLPVHGMVNPTVIHNTLLNQLEGFSSVSALISGEDLYHDGGNYLCLVKFCSPVFEDRLVDYFGCWARGMHPESFQHAFDYLRKECVPDSLRSFSL